MKKIIIATSKFGNPISDYYKHLGMSFIKKGFKVIFIFDNSNFGFKKDELFSYYSWPSKRPTSLRDFLFIYKLIKKKKPKICISNFGSTNVVTIISYILGVDNIINYVHTTTKQLKIDNKRNFVITYLLQLRKKFIYSLMTFFLTNSLGNKKDFIDNYHIKESKVFIFNYLIADTRKKIKIFDERQFCIAIVGRLHESKGHKSLIKHFKYLIKYYPDLKLKIIGDGYLKSELIKITEKLDLEKNISFLGKVPNKEVSEIFSNSILSISASQDEAFGLVNIEALREGTPLLCTKNAGSKDIVKPSNNGLIYDIHDSISFKNSFDEIFKDWNFYSENARQSFKNKYSYYQADSQVNKLKKLISKKN